MKMIDRKTLNGSKTALLEMGNSFDREDTLAMSKELNAIARFFEKHPERWLVGSQRSQITNDATWTTEAKNRDFGGLNYVTVGDKKNVRFCSIGLRNNLAEIKDIDGSFRTFASQQAFDRGYGFIVGLNDGMHDVSSVVEGLRMASKALKLSTKKSYTFESAVNEVWAKNAKLLKVQQQRAKARIAARKAARQLVGA